MGVLPKTLVEPGFLPRCSKETKGTFFFLCPQVWQIYAVHLSHWITIIKIKSRLDVCRYFSRGIYETSCVSHDEGRSTVTAKHSLLWERRLAKSELGEDFSPAVTRFSPWKPPQKAQQGLCAPLCSLPQGPHTPHSPLTPLCVLRCSFPWFSAELSSRKVQTH